MPQGCFFAVYRSIISPCVIVSVLVTNYWGSITSVHDLPEIILSLIVMVPVLFSIFLFYYYLNRRWEKKNEMDEKFITANCYPNPFNPQTTLSYELSHPGNVTVMVFNAVGQQVKVYDVGHKNQGVHEVIFDASDLTSVLYFYRVESGYAYVTGKMLYFK